MARHELVMPKMGESIMEATILKWHKKVGDPIAKDETLYEISTDKVDAEIPSPSARILTEILVEINKTVAVGTVVARIGSQGEQVKLLPTPLPSTVMVSSFNLAEAASVATDKPKENLKERLKTKSSPLVREMAKQHHIDLGQI